MNNQVPEYHLKNILRKNVSLTDNNVIFITPCRVSYCITVEKGSLSLTTFLVTVAKSMAISNSSVPNPAFGTPAIYLRSAFPWTHFIQIKATCSWKMQSFC